MSNSCISYYSKYTKHINQTWYRSLPDKRCQICHTLKFMNISEQYFPKHFQCVLTEIKMCVANYEIHSIFGYVSKAQCSNKLVLITATGFNLVNLIFYLKKQCFWDLPMRFCLSQIDFQNQMSLHGISVQGSQKHNYWITHYILSYSTDGSTWNEYRSGFTVVSNGMFLNFTIICSI